MTEHQRDARVRAALRVSCPHEAPTVLLTDEENLEFLAIMREMENA